MSQEKDNKPNLSGEVKLQWLDLEKQSPLRSRRSFFLTSLFIELIDKTAAIAERPEVQENPTL